jgi:hypothetical protein
MEDMIVLIFIAICAVFWGWPGAVGALVGLFVIAWLNT